MIKKLKYSRYLPRIFKNFTNWYLIPLVVLRLRKTITLRLKDGVEFKLKHLLDILTIIEIYVDDDYEVSKLKDPAVIMDIGANIGTFSILSSRKHPDSIVYSYEPSKTTYDLMRRNIELNEIGNVKYYNLGVSGKIGKRTFFSHPASGLSSVVKKRKGMKKTTIRTTTLSKIFKDNNIKKCDLLKIDAEGSEYEIILGLPKIYYKFIKRIAVEYHDNLTSQKHLQLVNHLKKVGYNITLSKHPIEKDIGLIYAKR